MERIRNDISIQHPRCPFCHDGIAPEQEKEGCRACMAWHHRECWEAHGGCSACGAIPRAPTPAVTRAPRPARVEHPLRVGPRCVRRRCEQPAVAPHREGPLCLRHAIRTARRAYFGDQFLAISLGLGSVVTGVGAAGMWGPLAGILSFALLGLAAGLVSRRARRAAARLRRLYARMPRRAATRVARPTRLLRPAESTSAGEEHRRHGD